MSENLQGKVYVADDPIWIDDVWVDTVVVVGLTCFILCLMGLSKVSKAALAALLSRIGSLCVGHLFVFGWIDVLMDRKRKKI